jgi:hypothetical protein
MDYFKLYRALFIHYLIIMKRIIWLTTAAALAVTAGCATSTPADRIAAHQADFATWPPGVQANVQAGQVAVGFTPEQVLVALGAPDLKTAAAGPQQTTEVWVYHRRAPRLGIGVGFGSVGRRSAVGGGVSANGIPLGQDMDGRVIFTNGYVTDVVVTSRG